MNNPSFNKPFFYIKKTGDKIVTRGEPSCFLGHKIDGWPDGVFAQWHWDGKQLIVENDKFGFYPVYYFQKGAEFCISASIPQILRNCSAKDFDFRALSIFLRLGFFIKEDTPFKDIKTLSPRSVFVWREGKLKKQNDPIFLSKAVKISKERAMDGFVDLFRKAMKKRLPQDDDFVLPISGGRDSRHILFTLKYFNKTPKFCITHHHYPPRPDEDVRIARLLVSELGLKHVVIKQDRPFFEAESRKNLMTSFCSDEHAQTLVMSDYLRGRTKVTYDGIAGMLIESFLIKRHDLQLYANREYTRLAEELFQRWGPDEEILKIFLSKQDYAQLNRDQAIADLAEEIKCHAEAVNPIASFHFWNRTRREISLIPYAIFDHIPYVYSPYLDHELSAFLFSLPFELVEDGVTHTEVIHRAYPQYQHIPFAEKNSSRVDAAAHVDRFNRATAGFYLRNFKFSRPLLNNQFLSPRFLRSLLSSSYRKSLDWLPFSKILYLTQLEEVIHFS